MECARLFDHALSKQVEMVSTKSWELQGDTDAALLPVRGLAFP
jgi:hypothetical protein